MYFLLYILVTISRTPAQERLKTLQDKLKQDELKKSILLENNKSLVNFKIQKKRTAPVATVVSNNVFCEPLALNFKFENPEKKVTEFSTLLLPETSSQSERFLKPIMPREAIKRNEIISTSLFGTRPTEDVVKVQGNKFENIISRMNNKRKSSDDLVEVNSAKRRSFDKPPVTKTEKTSGSIFNGIFSFAKTIVKSLSGTKTEDDQPNQQLNILSIDSNEENKSAPYIAFDKHSFNLPNLDASQKYDKNSFSVNDRLKNLRKSLAEQQNSNTFSTVTNPNISEDEDVIMTDDASDGNLLDNLVKKIALI